MLIDFKYLSAKYNFKPKGVLHIGAHEGQEAQAYQNLGVNKVVWIEANRQLYERLLKRLQGFNNQYAVHALVSDKSAPTTFNIANNDGQSSSILELGTHETVHPEVKYVGKTVMQSIRVDEIDYNFSGLDFLNIDIQGAELLALKGMGKLLDQFKYVYLEVNWDELYQGCPLIGELDVFLSSKGFHLKESIECGNTGWGDGFWMK